MAWKRYYITGSCATSSQTSSCLLSITLSRILQRESSLAHESFIDSLYHFLTFIIVEYIREIFKGFSVFLFIARYNFILPLPSMLKVKLHNLISYFDYLERYFSLSFVFSLFLAMPRRAVNFWAHLISF